MVISTKASLIAKIEDAPCTATDVYRSCTAVIQRVDLKGGGSYFLLVESDRSGVKDAAAFEGIESQLHGPWRERIIETDCYDRPHPELLGSTKFAVHVVHPDYRP